MPRLQVQSGQFLSGGGDVTAGGAGSGSLLDVDVFDFYNIHGVEGAAGAVAVPFFEAFLREELFFLHFGAEELAAFECESCLLECDGSVVGCDGCEACFLCLVVVSSGDYSAEIEGFSKLWNLLVVEREGEEVVLFEEAIGVPFGANEDESHGFIPKPPESAPRGCHHVETVGCSSGDEHPFFSDGFEGVFLADCFEGSFFHMLVFKFLQFQ